MAADNEKTLTFSAIKVVQPIGYFFVGGIPWKDLLEIAFADIRRLETSDLERYYGIQRELSADRVKQLKTYVNLSDATFPTAIILAVDEQCATWDPNTSKLTLRPFVPETTVGDNLDQPAIPYEKIARILDGQHRLAGLESYLRPEPFDINVAIFIGADISEQANIFATVNLAQTKVNRSLVYDLAELSKSRSPQKSAHNIAVALDALPDSPFHEKIKRLGVATPGRTGETLTQAAFVEMLMKFISSDPVADREHLKKGRRLSLADDATLRKLPFRNLFIEEEDDEMTKILWNYFAAIQRRWPTAYANADRGNIINKTNGFRAFMRFLKPLYVSYGAIGTVPTQQKFGKTLALVTLNDDDFTIDNFPPGTSGEAALFRRLKTDTGIA